MGTYGPSVQVKTCLNPQDLTSFFPHLIVSEVSDFPNIRDVMTREFVEYFVSGSRESYAQGMLLCPWAHSALCDANGRLVTRVC